MLRPLRLLAILAIALLASACSTPLPPYSPSVANADITTKLAAPLAVGRFGYAPGREAELNNVSGRGMSFESPVERSIAAYYAAAAVSELKAGGKYDASAPRVLTGVLEKNHLDASGTSQNESALAVRFKLSQGSETLYDRQVAAERKWESSFMGAIAIPLAASNYIATLQKLLGNLFQDPDFIRATGAK